MTLEPIDPDELDPPRGFHHGMMSPAGGRVLFVAGQTAAAPGAELPAGFTAQFDAALGRVLAVVRAAGGAPEHLARMTVYVTDMTAYRRARKELGAAWRERLGRHYPAMALVEVSALVDEGALVEIEATAVLPAADTS